MAFYLHARYALIGIGVTLIMMILGSDGAITMNPSNKAVLLGTSRVSMSCASDRGFRYISWSYLPVGGSSDVPISIGSYVEDAQSQSYAVEQSGSQQINLIFNATIARAGTYICGDSTPQQTSAQLIIINSDPVCSMTPNAPTELLYNQSVKMSCSISYTANTSYVAVDMIWSKSSPATNVNSSTPQYTTSGTLTTAVSTITQTPGYSMLFPIFSCNTSFKVTGNPPASANNAPEYSKSTQVNSPINVIYLKPADASSISGAKTGDRVYLGTTVTCNVEGNPPPSYSWWDVMYGNTTNSSSIQIWHSGEYQCTAWNRAASTSTSMNVTTFITTAAPTTTTPTTTVTSQSTSPSGSDSTARTEAPGPSGGLSETNKIIVGVVVGVGGALLIVAITILICCCLKKNKADKYSGSSEGTLSKPPPYEDSGHRGPQRSTNPDLVQGGYPMDEYSSKDLSSPYSTASHHDRPYIDEDGLNYAQIQLDNNPRSRQPLQVAEGTNYSDVRLA